MTRFNHALILVLPVLLTACGSNETKPAKTFDAALDKYVGCVAAFTTKELADAAQNSVNISNADAVDEGILRCKKYVPKVAYKLMSENLVSYRNADKNAKLYVIPIIEKRTREYILNTMRG